ncbi:MAG: DUF2510 domain-containing protein [Acidimicrobiales bacterium]
MTNPDGPVAGWYPDPYDADQLRYFDGQNWTESVSPAGGGPAAPEASGAFGQPDPGYSPSGAFGQPSTSTPQYGQPPAYAPQYGQPYTPVDGTGLGDVGSWLGESLSALFSRVVPLTLLLFVVPAIGTVAAALLALTAIDGLVYERGPDRFTGFEPGPLILAGAIIAIVALVGLVTWLGAHHQMYSTHVGTPATVGRSLSVGLARLPRAIGYGLLLALGVVAAYAAVVVLVVVAAGVGEGAGILVGVLVGLTALIALFWVGIRLSFLAVAVAVDTRTNPFSASWSATRGRFWAVFGRLLLVGVASYIVSFVFQFAANGVLTVSLPSYLDTTADGDVIINGVDVAAVDVLRFGDLLPSTGVMLVTLLLYVLGQAASQALTVSAMTGLYARAGGPAEV